MSDWQWINDPTPQEPDPVTRALAATGLRKLRHDGTLIQLAEHDTPDPPDYNVCAAPHLGWRRYRVIVLESEQPPAFDVLESQAFPVIDGEGDEATGRRATAEGARQFGLDVLDDAHAMLHP